MFGGETTRCGRALLITNFFLSTVLLISLSAIILSLTFRKSSGGSINYWNDPWNDDVEVNSVCGFNQNPIIADNGTKYGKLKWLGALFRHGDRTPIWFLPTDPYKDYHWPEGHEMLTNIGRRRMFCYGTAFGRRYENFISEYHVSR